MTNGLLLYYNSNLYRIDEHEYKSINEELEKECINVHFQTSEEFFKEITTTAESNDDDLFNICILNDSENLVYEYINVAGSDKIPLAPGRFADRINLDDSTKLSSIIEKYCDTIRKHIRSTFGLNKISLEQRINLYSKLISILKSHDDEITFDCIWLLCEEIDDNKKARRCIHRKYTIPFIECNLTVILEKYCDRDEVKKFIDMHVEERKEE